MKNLVNLRHGRLVGVLVVAAALAACGSDGSTDSATSNSTAAPVAAAAATPSVVSATTGRVGNGTTEPPTTVTTPVGVINNPPGTGDTAPLISGAAAPSAKVGQLYSFQPSATDPNQSTLTFSISDAPKWATFSAATGRLSGTPTSADVGVTQNIVVQVSDGMSSAALAPFSITVAAVGASTGSATLSWVAPTQNTDGSALADLGGYVISYGTTSKNYTSAITVSNAGLTTYVVGDLPAGTYYFSMTTTATNGARSAPSAEAIMTIG
ncbi:MAG TPA: putative Ig domain-containing protein [Steroidobacteraceae bacterium]